MHNIYRILKKKEMIMVGLALIVFIMIYSGISMAQGTITLKMSANILTSTYGEEVTFTATAINPEVGGTAPSGTVTFKDSKENLSTASLIPAEPIIMTGTAGCSYDCPTIKWGEYTYRAFRYADNRIAMNIVAYDNIGNKIKEWEKPGARYLSQITMDAAAQTFTLWGQDSMTITVGWKELLTPSSSASFKTSDLAVGSHSITAEFSGDEYYAASESSALLYTVHPKYTVMYNGNGSTAGEVPTTSSSFNGTKALIYGNNGNLIKNGYSFAGWNTQANGQGTYYAPSAEGTISSNVMLYAHWNKVLDMGTGTESDPYQVSTAEELDTVRNYLGPDLYFKLTANIDLSSYGQRWLPIGLSSKQFQGNMDGNGYKITGLTINRPDDNYVGLFGYVGYNASITNMNLENVSVSGRQDVGSLVGRNQNGKISNSRATGSVTGKNANIGGLIGYNYYGTIDNSFVTVSVEGGSNVGGLSGNNVGTISNSYAAGKVTGSGNNTGGLTGSNNGTISSSYATGKVTGTNSTGGGLTGRNNGTISHSFYDSGTTGQSDTGKGVGQTTSEMKLQSTYGDPGWNFTSIWRINPSLNNGYPYLQAIQKIVSYNGNGETGGIAPTDSNLYSQGVTVNVYGNAVTLVKTGYTFAGWNTQASGTGTDYAAGAVLRMGASDVTLFAKWTLIPSYTVTYNGNGSTGGSVPTDSGSYVQGVTVSVYGNKGNLVRTGYTFAGWNTAADGIGMSYSDGVKFIIGEHNVAFYAQWLSANTLLSGLSLKQGPLLFSPTQTKYNAEVLNSVSSVDLFLSKADPTQSLTVTGAVLNSVTDDVYAYTASGLVVGPNPVRITVTAQDGANTAYEVIINRKNIMGEPMPLDPSVRTLRYPGGLEIRLPDGLLIPEGATLTVQHSNAAPSGKIKLARAGQVIDFQFKGMTVTQPVQITLGYDESSDRSKLAIYYYNVPTGNWEYNPAQLTDNGIKTTVSHFSIYGVLADTTAPDQVTVTSGAKTAQSITLQLAANDDSGVAKYMIYRDGALIAETAENTSVDTGLFASKTYTYTVKAVDMLGNVSNFSESMTIATNGSNNGGAYLPARRQSELKVTSTGGNVKLPAGKAGEVSLGDAIKIVIPANATRKELEVTIGQVSDIQTLITSKDVLLSPVFEVVKNFTENFDEPVTLSLKFDPDSLKSEEKPAVFYYDESKKEWLNVGGTVSGNTIAVNVNHFTKYVVMAVADATPSATDEIAPTKVSFSDITAHWAEAGIKQAVSAGIVNGYPDGTFKPGQTVTREEFAVMLINALKLQVDGAAALTFTDKAKIGSWAQKSVAMAVYTGVTDGYEDGSFRPNAEITRAEMTVMIAKALNQTGGAAAASDFADDKDIPVWAKGAVAALKKLNIIKGKSANHFAPGDKTTRAEAVTVLLNMQEQKSK